MAILLLIFVLVLSLHSRLRYPVQITLARLCNATTALLLVRLKHANLLQRLHDFAIYRAGSIYVVRRARASVLGAAVDFSHAANTDGLAHVDVAGDGGGADVEPWRKSVSSDGR